jgi:hypothetical protein
MSHRWARQQATGPLSNCIRREERLANELNRPRGDSTRPLSREELRSKFDDCVRVGGIAEDSGERLWNELIAVGSGTATPGRLLGLAGRAEMRRP